MEFDRIGLTKAIQRAASLTNRKDKDPSHRALLMYTGMENDQAGMYILSHRRHMCMRSWVVGEGDRIQGVGVEAGRFNDLLHTLGSEKVEMLPELNEHGHPRRIVLKTRVETKLKRFSFTHCQADIPEPTFSADKGVVSFNSVALAFAIKRASKCVAKAESRAMTRDRIFFEMDQKDGKYTLHVIGTTGPTLMHNRIDAEEGSVVDPVLLGNPYGIDPRDAEFLRKALEADAQPVRMRAESDIVLSFEGTGYVASIAKNVSFNPPPYRQALGVDLPYRLTVSKAELSNAMRQLSIQTEGAKQKGIWKISKDGIVMSADTPLAGGDIEMSHKGYDGPDVMIKFSPLLVQTALDVFKEPDVPFNIKDGYTVAKVSGKTFDFYIMPMR